MDKLRPGWRVRQSKKKSLWHLLKLLIMFSAFVILFSLFFNGYKTLQFEMFSTENLNGNSGMGLLPLIIPAFGLGAIIANLVLHSIPAARASFEREANGDPELTNEYFMSMFIPVVFKYMLPIGCGLSFLLMWVLNA